MGVISELEIFYWLFLDSAIGKYLFFDEINPNTHNCPLRQSIKMQKNPFCLILSRELNKSEIWPLKKNNPQKIFFVCKV